MVVANVLANRYNKSYDATSNKRYSLPSRPQDRQRAEAGRDHHLLRPDHAICSEARTCSTSTRTFAQGPRRLRRSRQGSASWRARPAFATIGTAIVQVGDKKEKAKSITEEGITGAFIRDLKNNTRTVCFVSRQRRAPDRRHRPRRLLRLQGPARQGQLRDQVHQPAAESRSARRLHGARRRRPDQQLRAARSRRHQEIRRRRRARALHARSAAKMGRSTTSPTTMRSPRCSQAGASRWTRT